MGTDLDGPASSRGGSPERVVLLTGACGGLGSVMARALMRDGHRVFLTDQKPDQLAELGSHATANSHVAWVAANISEAAERVRVVDCAVEAFGRVDVLVNNAAVAVGMIRPDYMTNPEPLWDVPIALFDRFFAINSTAPFHFAALLAPSMVERGWGRIINVTTSLDTMLKMPFYGGSKAALEAHTSAMADQVEGTGVTANVLIPGGATASSMTLELGVPREAMYSPEIMDAPIRWLTSDAANGVNGRRFRACDWDAGIEPHLAAEAAGAPVAWRGFGTFAGKPGS
jgi:NAD(P)-dependent dehydrogenase (short-subunit alcohol dehydrogenase family)